MKASALPTLLIALSRSPSTEESDAALLNCFTNTGDQSAFSQLVQRYARLVWRVARTRCRTEATAEDVIQATFVVLAKKAASIRSAGALAGWLHRTAHRLAVKAAKTETRPKPEPVQPKQTNPLDELSARELLATVDDELAKLTDAERSVLILCGVDGEPLDDVATRLGCSATVVKGRLQRARAKLRSRLEARGLTLPAVLVGLFAAPSLPTIQAAVYAATTSTYSLAISTLIAEGLTMKATMLKATLTLALCGMIAIVGGGSGSPNPSPNATAAPLPKEKDEALIWMPDGKMTEMIGYLSTGDEKKRIKLPKDERFEGLTPAGQIVTVGKKSKTIHLRPLVENAEATDTGIPFTDGDGYIWSADSKQVLRIRIVANDSSVNGSTEFSHTLIVLSTGKKTELKLPKHHRVTQWSPDGTWWLVIESDGEFKRLYRYPVNGNKPTKLSDDYRFALSARLSPNGESIAAFAAGKWNAGTEATVEVISSKGGSGTILHKSGTVLASNGSWSPDGKQLVYLTIEEPTEGTERWKWTKKLTVSNADGTNAKVVKTWEKTDRNDDDFARLLGCAWLTPNAKPAVREKINAPLPKALKKQDSAWGEEVEGLQAELRMPSGTTVEPGQTAEMQVVVRNNSKKTITLEYTDQVLGVYVAGESVDGKVELGFGMNINGNFPQLRDRPLGPGDELVRWKLLVRHTPKDESDVLKSQIDLPAGKYLFRMEKVRSGDIKLNHSGNPLDQLGTGSLEVNLLEPTRRNISAPLPKPKFEWKEGMGIEFKSSPYGDRITSLAHSPDGKFIAVAVGEQVHLLDATTQKPVNEHALTAKAPGTITSVAFSPKGDKLAMTAKDFVFLYSELGKSPSVSSNSSWMNEGFDPHQIAFSTDKDDNFCLAATNGEETAIRIEKGNTSTDWMIAGGVKTKHKPMPFVIVPRTAMLLRLSLDKDAKDPKPELQLCDVVDGTKSKWLKGHKARPTAAVVSADGKRIVSADEGGTLIVWEGEKAEFKEKARVQINGAVQLTLAPDGKTLAVMQKLALSKLGAFGGTATWFELFVFDATDLPKEPKPIWIMEPRLDGDATGHVSLAFSPDGKKLLAAFADPYINDKEAKSMGIKVWERTEQK
jgi:RNA polymerase sigma factor (sigma-70 family)